MSAVCCHAQNTSSCGGNNAAFNSAWQLAQLAQQAAAQQQATQQQGQPQGQQQTNAGGNSMTAYMQQSAS